MKLPDHELMPIRRRTIMYGWVSQCMLLSRFTWHTPVHYWNQRTVQGGQATVTVPGCGASHCVNITIFWYSICQEPAKLAVAMDGN